MEIGIVIRMRDSVSGADLKFEGSSATAQYCGRRDYKINETRLRKNMLTETSTTETNTAMRAENGRRRID